MTTTSVDSGRVRPAGWRPLRHFTERSLLGFLIVAVAGVGFGVLLALVRLHWSPLYTADRGVAAALNARVAGSPTTVATLEAIARLGGRPIMIWLVAAAVVMLLARRRTRLALFLVVAGAGALVLDPSVKTLVGRLRPVVEDPVAHAPGNSFPSGHALGSAVVYGALLLVFLPAVRGRWRTAVITVVALLVTAVGITRIALGVHFLSDVLAGWLLAAAWLGVTAHAFRAWRAEAARPAPPSSLTTGRAPSSLTTARAPTAGVEPSSLAAGLEPEAAADLEPAPDERHLLEHPRAATAEILTGWVLVFGILYAFGMLVSYYVRGTWVDSLDMGVERWLADHRTPLLNDLSYLGSKAGDTHAILLISLLVCPLALAFWKRWRPILFLVLAMFGELTLFLASSEAVGRPRPPVEHLDGRLPTDAFPSGHIAATLCLWTTIAILVLPRVRHWSRWIVLALAVLMPVVVALSRMYRGMHHPTDVVGALILAAAWIGLLYWAVRPNEEITPSVPGPRPPASDRVPS
jgi:membrane-associated phospholipid phosphatase